jgi:ERCC4-related helicase
MAKRKADVNKSQAIRDIVSHNPQMTIKEVVSTLAGQGIKVSDTYVYMVRSKARRQKRKEKRQRAIAAGNGAGVMDPVQLVVRLKELASHAGGMRHLKKLVDILAE